MHEKHRNCHEVRNRHNRCVQRGRTKRGRGEREREPRIDSSSNQTDKEVILHQTPSLDFTNANHERRFASMVGAPASLVWAACLWSKSYGFKEGGRYTGQGLLMQPIKKCNHISTTSTRIGPTYTIQGGLTWDHYLSLGTQFHLIYLKTSCDKTFCTNHMS
jgi:hypothetical protein